MNLMRGYARATTNDSEAIVLQGLDPIEASGNTRVEEVGNGCAVKLNDRKQKPARCCALQVSSAESSVARTA